jgi:predicted homoserine dehydrogenase-like protein
VGGLLDQHGMVEVISSVERDGRPVFRDLRWGVYVVFRAGRDAGREYVRRCFREYGLVTDKTGEYTAMYKPYHLIGLELGISVASVGVRNEPTGAPLAWWHDGPIDWRADVVATAKRDLKHGEALDGEGGYTVYGKILTASESVDTGSLPLGLAHGCKLKRNVGAHETVRWDDVIFDQGHALQQQAIAFRQEMEALLD